MKGILIEESKDEGEIPLEVLLMADPSREMIEGYLHDGIRYVAKENERIIGALVLLRTRPGCMEIMNVSVLEEHRYKGIGRRLIEQATERAKRDGIRTLHIGTGNPGVGQMLLYQKCGFRIIGVELDFFRKRYKEKIIENGIECRDMIRMEMDLRRTTEYRRGLI
jgi:GNAT superfamily N-acetyltransferase